MRLFCLLAILLACFSCAKIQHLEGALTLKAYSDEGDAREAMVVEHDRRFEGLVALVKSNGSLKTYRNKKDFISAFGEPILTERQNFPDGNWEERLLYRYMTRYLDGPKVYVFFDEKGAFLRLVPFGIPLDDKKS